MPVYEVGEEGPICYIASAYCEGPTLAQWLRRQTAAVPIRVASQLVAVLAAAVAHAHERGILHRDLKPGNILLQQRDGNPSTTEPLCHDLGFLPRICDFGLAKLLDQVSHETRTGVPIGSPEYMAPEQAGGRLQEHGPATDIYALGVILYELVTGRPPHRGQSDLETLRLVSDQDPPPPRSLRPSLPRNLETITLKCLEKRPARRYSSAAALTDDLQRFLGGSPVKARPIPVWEHAGKWARRRPVHAALLVVLAALVLAVLGGLEWARVREKKHGDELRLALENSRRSETEAREHRAVADRERLLAYQHLAANQLKLAGLLLDRGEYESAISILDSLGPPRGPSDSRGFAWNCLDRLVRPPTTMLPGLPRIARAIAVRPDGRLIALTDDANNAFLLDRDTGTLKQLPGEPKLTVCQRLVFSRNGRSLASLSHDARDWGKSEVKVWDVKSGTPWDGMPEYLNLCYQVVFSPDGRTLVTAEAVYSNRSTPIRAWKLSDDGKHITLGESLSGNQLKDRLSPAVKRTDPGTQAFQLCDVLAVTNGRSIEFTAVTLESGEIELYDAGSGYLYAVCRVVGPEVVFVPRTDRTVACTPAEVDDIGRVACAVTARAHARPISAAVPAIAARFSVDGRAAAVCHHYPDRPRGDLRVFDVATGTVGVETTWGNVGDRCAFAFTPGGDALIATGFDAHARVWEFNGWRAPGVLSGHNKEVWGLAFSRDGRTLVSSSDDHTVKLWALASGLEQKTLKGHGSLVTAVAYSPDGTLLASAGWDETIRLWKAATGAPLATLEGHTDHVFTLAFSPDGNTLASGGADRTIRLWDVPSGRALDAPLTGHTNRVHSVAFAHDGKTLYSGALDKTIRLWDWEERRLRVTWRAEDKVLALACSPDGQTLAVAQTRGTIRLWDVIQQKARPPLRGHEGDVLGIAFSPDGLTLASVGRDHSVRIWDPVTGHEMLTLKGHTAPVHGIAFSPDGAILATGSHDGAIKLWRASPRSMDQKASARALSIQQAIHPSRIWSRATIRLTEEIGLAHDPREWSLGNRGVPGRSAPGL